MTEDFNLHEFVSLIIIIMKKKSFTYCHNNEDKGGLHTWEMFHVADYVIVNNLDEKFMGMKGVCH